MRKGMVWAVGLMAVLLLGLFFGPAEAQKAKNVNVNLKAAFRDLPPGEGTAGDMIRSDGNGTYINGVDGVQCYISPNGELKFVVDSPKRNVFVDLGEYQRAPSPFNPSDPTIYPTDYYSGLVGDFEFSAQNSDYVIYPLNLLQMVPDPLTHQVSRWGAALFRYMPTVWGKDRYFLRFYFPNLSPATICSNSGCVVLVTGYDLSPYDGQIESWDLEPIPTLGASTNVAYAYRYENRTRTCFGWFYMPFKLTVERLK
jgi:hypothetical protein